MITTEELIFENGETSESVDEITQLILINSDERITEKDRIDGISFVTTMASFHYGKDEDFLSWICVGQKRVIKKASSEEIQEFVDTLSLEDEPIFSYAITPKYNNVNDEPVYLAVALKPMRSSELDNYNKDNWNHLK